MSRNFIVVAVFYFLLIPATTYAAQTCWFNDADRPISYCESSHWWPGSDPPQYYCETCSEYVTQGYGYVESTGQPLYICANQEAGCLGDCGGVPQPSNATANSPPVIHGAWEGAEYTTYIIVLPYHEGGFITSIQYICTSKEAFDSCAANELPDYSDKSVCAKKLFNNP